MTLNVSLPALATTSQRPLGDNASAPACRPVTISDFGAGFARLRTFELARSITDTEPSLAMERASTRTCVPCPAGPVTLSALGPAAAPVADVNFVAGEHHVVRRHAHVPNSQHPAGRGVQFGQAVGKIERNIKFFAVRGNGDAGGNFRRA